MTEQYDLNYVLKNNDGMKSYHAFLQAFLEQSDSVEFGLIKSKALTLSGFKEEEGSKNARDKITEISSADQETRLTVKEEKIKQLQQTLKDIFQTDTHLLAIITDVRAKSEGFKVETDPYQSESSSFVRCNSDMKEKISYIDSKLQEYGSSLEKVQRGNN